MDIHAYAAHKRGAKLEPWQYEAGDLGPYDVRVKILACGVCHSDIHVLDNDWGNSHYPLVPGHEIVGMVDEAGSMVTHLKTGDPVGIGWQRSSCLQCDECLEGNENLCSESKAIIIHGHGGFADMIVTDARFAFKWPSNLDPVKSSPLLCAGITVYSALRHAGMTSGQDIGVIGVGGLGHLAVQFAARMGNRVTVFTTSEDKAQFALTMGAREAVVLEKGEPPIAPFPLDILMNTAPAPLDWGAFIHQIRPDGTLTFVGNPGKNLDIPVGLLLGKRRRVMGSPIGGRRIMREMLHVADTFGIEPVTEVFPMEKVNDAIQKVRDNTVRYRAVLTV